MKTILFIFNVLFVASTSAQIPANREKYIYSPIHNDRDFNASLGMLFTTTQRDITEEYQFRIPAIDFHISGRLYRNLLYVSELNSQILQNHLSAGLKLQTSISERVSISIGDDIGYWFGNLKTEGFDTRAFGIMNYPNISGGMRFGKDVLVTLKIEAILNLSVHSFVGDIEVTGEKRFYSGEAVSIILEQPFYHQSWFVLGFRGMYANYFWQTWSLYETFDRNIFYPQLIFGFML